MADPGGEVKIYVAASWRTELQPSVVRGLRALGHEVYDFRENGFAWAEIDPEWRTWTPEEARGCLLHPRAVEGFNRDKGALDWCDVCVLVLPSGRSAHLELGYAIGQGKPGIVFWPSNLHPYDPDLMYGFAQYIVVSSRELFAALKELAEAKV
jgi:hypothetical protein